MIHDEAPYTPVVHAKNWHLIRVPIKRVRERDGYIYTVYVGDNHQRTFSNDSLPDVLKIKFAMILVNDWTHVSDDNLIKMELYSNKQTPELSEVGWRASESYFCLVLDRLYLISLQGGKLTKDI